MHLRNLGLGSAAFVATAAILVSACGSDDDSDSSELQVSTTVAPITNIAANVVGDCGPEIKGIVPEGTNSHTFEPQPSVAEQIATTDILYVNGLQLEEPTVELADENLPDEGEIVELGTESIPESEYAYDFSFPEEEGKPNPHLWTDPIYAVKYAEIIKDDLSERDPENAACFEENFDKFEAKVGEFDAAMRTAFDTLPRDERKLLTYHDAYAYFAEDYGWDVIGAIQVSDFEDPTAKEVAALIDQVKAAGVPAIFGSEVFPSPVLEQIGNEANVEYVDVLRDDDLPDQPGDPSHSWMGLMHFDYVTMVEALGGDASALKAFQPENVAPDGADYPQ